MCTELVQESGVIVTFQPLPQVTKVNINISGGQRAPWMCPGLTLRKTSDGPGRALSCPAAQDKGSLRNPQPRPWAAGG